MLDSIFPHEGPGQKPPFGRTHIGLVLVVAMIGAALGVYYFHRPSSEMVEVLVAKRVVNNGEPIRSPQEMFVAIQIIKGKEPPDAIASFNELEGRVAKKSLRLGAILCESDLLNTKDPQTGSSNLPEGFRLLRVPCDPDLIEGGERSLPLARVDVFVIRKGKSGRPIETKLLDDVFVIKVESRDTTPADPRLTVFVEFALSSEDAMKLSLSRDHEEFAIRRRNRLLDEWNALSPGFLKIVSSREAESLWPSR